MTRKTHNSAVLIIDAQRGFMPVEEGERLELEGFGELTVPNAQNIVPAINKLTQVALEHALPVATTQDNHPTQTAHISKTPNFVTTWPAHCIAGTAGAELHPELIAATHQDIAHFIKGDVAATPAEDDSYTGFLAHRDVTGERQTLPEFMNERAIRTIYLGGLTIGDGLHQPLCVDSTALDFTNHGFDVALVTEAVAAVNPANRETCFRNLGEKGVRLVTLAEALGEIYNTPEEILR